jgi:hypothetical protein
MTLNEIATLFQMTPKQTIAFMLKQNKDVDYQNIPDNGYKSKKEVNEWWASQNTATIIKVYDEYYGIETK